MSYRPDRPATIRRGFSLIELMIAIAVIGLLAAVALPSFMDSVRKSRRSEAIAAMAAIQQAQERWRASNPTYTTTWANLAASSATPKGYYTLTLSTPAAPDDGIGYDVVATAASSQADDTPCKKMAVELRRGNLRYGSGTNAIDWADPNRCWAK
ncbi:MAG TPA: type IV pilin protein [Rubrivivax sp.]|nr:type IV pilin protein [Rubrivivax sp.]